MAQSAVTVTPPTPTPPTNYACTGARPPNPPNLTRQTYADPKTNVPPYFDDGIEAGSTEATKPHSINEANTPGNRLVFAAPTAALASGTTAADNNTGTTPGTAVLGAGGTGFNSVVGTYPGAVNGAVPASTSVAAEGAGTELAVTAPGSRAECPTIAVSCGPTLPAPTVGGGPISPNQNHASSLSPATNPALTSITPTTAVSGPSGTVALTAVTGTNFTQQSVVYANGVAIPTVFVSATTLTATMPKKTSAGTWPVTVVTGGAVTTAAQTFTWT